MRVLFMGTPDFAVPSLEILIENGYEICGVYTQPDKPKGRGHKLQFSPVKELALTHGVSVFQPNTLRTKEAAEQIRALDPELIVVVAYGKILPRTVLEIPAFGCINVHGSLLPKYRGAAPIQWTVLNGDKTAGVTTMYMADGIDTGNILLKAETPVGAEETAGELFDRLKDLGARLLLQTLERLQNGRLHPEPQKEDEATLAPMLSKDLAALDWNRPAEELHCFIRGLNPWPSAYGVFLGKKVKIHRAKVFSLASSEEPGTLAAFPEGLVVFCGTGALLLTEIQPENSKRMDGKSYLLGHPLPPGAKFEIDKG